MPITYKNRKNRTYYLCQDISKTGKPRYYFSREQKGEPLEAIPKGYEISESVNGVVSLTKVRPILLLDEEIEAIKSALKKHPQAKMYRLDIKPKQLTIYEQVGPDLDELTMQLGIKLGFSKREIERATRHLEEEGQLDSQFTPIMRFILSNAKKRHFRAQRMSFFSNIDDWIDIAYDKSIEELTNELIPTLGTDEFFELY
jgi:hypothetical protein